MEQVNVDEVVHELRRRVAQRRADGDYPPGLEEQLEAQFAQIMKAVHRHEVDSVELGHRIDALGRSASQIGGQAAMTSRIPGGGAVHGTTARLVTRHTNQLAAEVRQFGHDTALALQEIRRLVDAQRSADERQMHEVIASLLDRVAVVDHLADAVIDLERRVSAIESQSTAT